MSTNNEVVFTSPVGRLVAGSLYEGNDTDATGKPLVTKTGSNAGQPRLDYYFALAIPKGAEQHWAQTPWGQKIYSVGQQAWPQGQFNQPKFAWKITDGDSVVANTNGKKPCDREGYRGHWVLNLSSGFAAKVFEFVNGAWVALPDGTVKLGSYVEVQISVKGNGATQQPGIYLNHRQVAFRAYGPEISIGPDPSSAGFGAAPLPNGASATPLASAAPMPGMPPMPPQPGMPLAPLVPNPAAVAPMPPMPPAAPVRQMLPAANGATYEQLIALGWTDATLVQNGMMAAPVAAPLVPVGSAPPLPPSAVTAPVPVNPNPGFVQIPPAPPKARVMLPAANGATYEQLIGVGWTDAALIAAAMMAA